MDEWNRFNHIRIEMNGNGIEWVVRTGGIWWKDFYSIPFRFWREEEIPKKGRQTQWRTGNVCPLLCTGSRGYRRSYSFVHRCAIRYTCAHLHLFFIIITIIIVIIIITSWFCLIWLLLVGLLHVHTAPALPWRPWPSHLLFSSFFFILIFDICFATRRFDS